MNAVEAIVGSAIAVGVLDAGWLTLRYNYHNDLFYKIQKSQLNPRIVPAVLIYLLIPVAIFLYAVKDAQNTKDAAFKGALIGFILYADYECDFSIFALLNRPKYLDPTLKLPPTIFMTNRIKLL